MEQKKQERKVVMLSVLGICFGFLGWGNVVSDFIYKKFSQVENIVFIISIIGLIHSTLCVIGNFVVLKISNKNVSEKKSCQNSSRIYFGHVTGRACIHDFFKLYEG